ncbi:C6 zinc finger domain-containing protein [Verticillium dahliae VdLs.17]|uniref:C6 zinc finger domain-containing protein n=1 Tax=Verticillium dahliae (strain VdLs.17 / ATCC MYA-4575 / FGSC 10137) TaxID=498257 RepID=G2WXP5_VERDV|nr:C6 zinc finger domain-containing protein [Verticillium dahliae VdLs.17]EGY20853.1 C6 zinc finger domain-containing protein [Verticillium dahliae VdLs.17]
MKQRKKHTKSRTGCSECKRRKVKCDELRPRCANCRRQGSSCSYSRSDSSQQTPGATPSLAGAAERKPWEALIPQLSRCHTPGGNSPSWVDQSPFSRDAELAHHWSTVTADAMATDPDMRHMWRVVIPRIGYENCFVMHGVLAISALHKAYLMPGLAETYLNVSAHHQVRGSEGFRALLGNVTQDNWRPVFCFSGTFVAYMMCLPIRSPNGTIQSPVVSLLDLVAAMMGVQASIKPFLPVFMSSEFSPTVRNFGEIVDADSTRESNPDLEHSLLPHDTFNALFTLRLFFEAELPAGEQDPYLNAVDKLEAVARVLGRAGLHADPGVVFFWATNLDQVIISDSRAFQHHALMLWAHFAVFLAGFERSFWYLRRWAKSIVGDVAQRVSETPRAAQVLQWPEKKVWERAL